MTQPDYEPLDLTAIYNASIETYAPPHQQTALGVQKFHGLPFHLGEPGSRCYIAFNTPLAAAGSVRVPVERQARWVIFAHVLLQSRLHEGVHPGGVVAEYA